VIFWLNKFFKEIKKKKISQGLIPTPLFPRYFFKPPPLLLFICARLLLQSHGLLLPASRGNRAPLLPCRCRPAAPSSSPHGYSLHRDRSLQLPAPALNAGARTAPLLLFAMAASVSSSRCPLQPNSSLKLAVELPFSNRAGENLPGAALPPPARSVPISMAVASSSELALSSLYFSLCLAEPLLLSSSRAAPPQSTSLLALQLPQPSSDFFHGRYALVERSTPAVVVCLSASRALSRSSCCSCPGQQPRRSLLFLMFKPPNASALSVSRPYAANSLPRRAPCPLIGPCQVMALALVPCLRSLLVARPLAIGLTFMTQRHRLPCPTRRQPAVRASSTSPARVSLRRAWQQVLHVEAIATIDST
jgi:hypothetical protein